MGIAPLKFVEADYPNISIDDETIAAIGRIIIGCALVDETMMHIIAKFARINPFLVHKLAGRTNIRSRFEIVESLYFEKESEQFHHFKNFRHVYTNLIKIRNAFAHSVYVGFNIEKGTFCFLEPATVENKTDLMSDARHIYIKRERILTLCQEPIRYAQKLQLLFGVEAPREGFLRRLREE
jgi:hypothetical protein